LNSSQSFASRREACGGRQAPFNLRRVVRLGENDTVIPKRWADRADGAGPKTRHAWEVLSLLYSASLCPRWALVRPSKQSATNKTAKLDSPIAVPASPYCGSKQIFGCIIASLPSGGYRPSHSLSECRLFVDSGRMAVGGRALGWKCETCLSDHRRALREDCSLACNRPPPLAAALHFGSATTTFVHHREPVPALERDCLRNVLAPREIARSGKGESQTESARSGAYPMGRELAKRIYFRRFARHAGLPFETFSEFDRSDCAGRHHTPDPHVTAHLIRGEQDATGAFLHRRVFASRRIARLVSALSFVEWQTTHHPRAGVERISGTPHR